MLGSRTDGEDVVEGRDSLSEETSVASDDRDDSGIGMMRLYSA